MKLQISLVAVVGGILAALGLLTLLQQNGTVYPTQNVAILAAVLGVAWGVLVPSIRRTLRIKKLRKRRATA